MKKHLAPYLLGLIAAVSCGTSGQYAARTQQFEDGIYADPRTEAPVAAVSQEEMDALVKESIESEVYVLSSGDTIVVPKGKTAKLRFDGNLTDITVVDSWDYSWYRPWYLNGYYGPWYYSSWAYWDPWYWDPWYYRSWYGYRPWRHYGFYDPWYYSSWYYDPWYYDPWYWGPSYYGYYGYPGWYGYHGYYGYYNYYGGYYGYGVGGWGERWINRHSHARQVGGRDGSLSSRSFVSRGGSGAGLTRSTRSGSTEIGRAHV